MPRLRTRLSQFALVGGLRRNHTDAIAAREPSRRSFGAARPHLYLLAEHAAADGVDHRFCHVVMRELQSAFVEEERAGAAIALARSVTRINDALWAEAESRALPPHKRLPIGLVAVALEGSDAFICQVATGQALVLRDEAAVGVPGHDYWQAVHGGVKRPTSALGLASEVRPIIWRCPLAPGDTIVLCASNLGRLLDPETVQALAAQPAENITASLYLLAENYGVQHTSGLTLHIAETPTPLADPGPLTLQVADLTPSLSTTTGATALVEKVGRVLARRPPTAAPVAVAHTGEPPIEQPATLAPTTSTAEDALPANVYRLYSEPPAATNVAPAPTARPAARATPRPERARPPVAPARRNRWMDALAASVGLATASAQRVAVGARSRPAPSSRRTARPISARPVYRATGDLDSALGDGPAATAVLRASSPCLPLPSAPIALLLIVIVTALLATPGLAQLGRLMPLGASGELPAAPAVLPPIEAAAPSGDLATVMDEQATLITGRTEPGMAGPDPSLIRDDASIRDAPSVPAVAPATSASLTVPGSAAPPTTASAMPVHLLSQTTTLADVSGNGTPASAPKQLIAGGGKLYLLDPYANTLFLIDQSGKAPTPLLTRGWTIAKAKVTDLLGATWRGDTLVVMDRQRAYTLDGPGGTWRTTPLAASGLGAGVHPVASFSRNLYVLDNAKQQVLKYTQGAYERPPQPWLTLDQRVDLAGAVDLAIDGRIYVLTAGGKLLHLYRGELEKTTTLEASPAVTSPAALISPAGSDYLYVAETNGRILKLTKDGRVVSQYQLTIASNQAPLSTLWIDEATQTLIAIVGNRVVKTRLTSA